MYLGMGMNLCLEMLNVFGDGHGPVKLFHVLLKFIRSYILFYALFSFLSSLKIVNFNILFYMIYLSF